MKDDSPALGRGGPYRRAQLAIAGLFCFLGFQYATWASRLPALKGRMDLNTAQLGLFLMVCGIGAAAAFPLVAVLMRRLGSRRLALGAALLLAAVLVGFATVRSYPAGMVLGALDGVGAACLNVAMNAQGAELEARYGRTTMARLHATFSGGSLGGALLASGVNLCTGSLLVHFAVAAALLLVLLAAARPGLLAQGQQPVAEPAADRQRRRFALPTGAMLWMGLAMAFGTIAEGAMNDWSALYLRDVAHAAAGLMPLGIAVVSLMMVLARVFADGWRARYGDGRIVRLGSALAGAGLALGLLAGGVVPALLGFACMGLGMAAVTPCVYVAAAGQGPEALSLVAGMGTTGLLAGPALIGLVAGLSGLAWGMAAIAACAGVVSLCALRIRFQATAPA
ncbi:MFS transporter [Streptomyces tateyamensis]|uniref:MFS transporter n=1 Tax=Streptomyces tateyamensis TaxID=565073 RepID=A0A2V4N7M2_9ACTN|nr:MFS transporter [Streptomyces tateyamensis]